MYNQNEGVKQIIKDLINFGLQNYKRTAGNLFIAHSHHVRPLLQELDTKFCGSNDFSSWCTSIQIFGINHGSYV